MLYYFSKNVGNFEIAHKTCSILVWGFSVKSVFTTLYIHHDYKIDILEMFFYLPSEPLSLS